MANANTHVVRITEINIAVRDVEESLKDLGEVLGVSWDPILTESTPPIQARFASFKVPGEAKLGVMASTEAGSPIERFVQRRGEAIFSISVQVDDVAATMADWQARGIQFVLPEPQVIQDTRVGGLQWREVRVNFTRPSPKLHGIVIEIQELHP